MQCRVASAPHEIRAGLENKPVRTTMRLDGFCIGVTVGQMDRPYRDARTHLKRGRFVKNVGIASILAALHSFKRTS